MERCVVALSSNSNQDEALTEIITQLESHDVSPLLMVVFSEYNLLPYCSKVIKNKYPKATIIGSSTYINFSSEGYSHSGISVMAINSGVECSAGLLFDANRYPALYKNHIKLALEKLSSFENTCCLEFSTAFGNGEDLVLDTFDDVLKDKNIMVVGGSAGEDAEKKQTLVMLDGEVYFNTCAFVFIHNLNGKINFFKENIYKPTIHRFISTDVDCEEQLVYEYDNQPAADILAEVLKTDLTNLEKVLESHPMGRVVDNEIYITESNEIKNDGAISYYARIFNHTKMVLLEVDDFQKVWKETSERVKTVVSNPSFCISINCLSRSKLFEKENCFGEFVNNLRQYGKFIGISGYGEQLGTIHLNQTMVLIIFE